MTTLTDQVTLTVVGVMMQRRQVLAAFAASVVIPSDLAAASPKPYRRNLEGLWDLGSYTELERPKGVSRLVMTPAEAQAYEAPRKAMHGLAPSTGDGVGQAENEWADRGDGLARVKGQIRSSTIIDPPDGLLPYRPGMAPAQGDPSLTGELDNPESMGGATRCVATVAAGAPMLGAPDANVIQIVQTKDQLAILSEKYHDVRIIRLVTNARDGSMLTQHDPPSWLGHSVGWWEGDTLEVRTRGFRAGVIAKGQRMLISGETSVSERLTKVAVGEIFYEFTVEDPTLFTGPWRGEQTIRAAKGGIFEYACHEGNYSLPGILAGARREESSAKAASTAK